MATGIICLIIGFFIGFFLTLKGVYKIGNSKKLLEQLRRLEEAERAKKKPSHDKLGGNLRDAHMRSKDD